MTSFWRTNAHHSSTDMQLIVSFYDRRQFAGHPKPFSTRFLLLLLLCLTCLSSFIRFAMIILVQSKIPIHLMTWTKKTVYMFSSMLSSERGDNIVYSTCRKYEPKNAKKNSITAVYQFDIIENVWWLLLVLVGAALSRSIQMIFFVAVLCAHRSFSFGSHCLALRYCCRHWHRERCFVVSTSMSISLLFSLFLSSTTMIRSPKSRTVGFFGTRHKKNMSKQNFLLAPKKIKRRKNPEQRQDRRRRNDY